MGVRKLVRGSVNWDRLEAVAREFAIRYDEPVVRVTFLEANNWLSTPFVVNDEWFVKVISRRNSLVHGLFTGARNLGAFSSGREGFFEHFSTPIEMAEHDLEAAQQMRELGVNVPEPIEAFDVEGLGVLVMEYLEGFLSLNEIAEDRVGGLADELFSSLDVMHAHGVVHGDLRAENVIVFDDHVYFIDATSVREDGIARARAYDLACALAVLGPIIGARSAVAIGFDYYDADEMLAARDFLDFVNIRPDHDFDAASMKGEIEKHAAGR